MDPRLVPTCIALALLAAALAPIGVASTPATEDVPVVFVANSKSGTVTVVDATTHNVVRTVDIIPNGTVTPTDPSTSRDPLSTVNALFVNEFAGENYAQDLDVSPDGETLFVSRGHLADVAAFDLTEDPAQLVWRTPVDGFRADHMTIGVDGQRLFVSDLTEDQVIAIGTDDGARVGTFPTGDYAHGVSAVTTPPAPTTMESENEVSPSGDCAFLEDGPDHDDCIYAASIGDIVLQPRPLRNQRPEPADRALNEPYRLTVADADSLEVLREIEFPDGIRPAAFDLGTDENLMYFQESEFHGIVEYDLEAAREVRRVQLPIDEGVTEDDYSFEAPHHGLAISPDESTLCAAARASDYVALVPTDTMLPEAIVEVGDAPGWAITGPTGQACWVSSAGSEAENPEPGANTVSIVPYDNPGDVTQIDTDEGPKHLLAAEVPIGVVGS